LADGEILIVDPDFKAFIARHVYDIVLITVVGVKLIVQGTTDLRSKLKGLFYLAGALYLCRFGSMKLLGPDTTVLRYVTVMIGMRLISVLIIMKVIDYDE
jgi:hypothetical protein